MTRKNSVWSPLMSPQDVPRGIAGLYVIYHRNVHDVGYPRRVVYVGQSKNIQQRLSFHEVYGAHDPYGFTVKVKVVCDRAERFRREARLIRRLSPPMNHRSVRHEQGVFA